MINKVMLENMHVTCPECDHTFKVGKKSTGGSTYVHDWKRLPRQCLNITSLWISLDLLRDFPNTKAMAYEICIQTGLKISSRAFSARVSELTGLGILKMTHEGRKISPEYNTKSPEYLLMLDRASKILNNMGRI